MPEFINIGERFSGGNFNYLFFQFFLFLRILTGILAIIFIFYSALKFYTSYKEENLKEAKGTLVFSIVGFIVSMMAFVIISMVLGMIFPERAFDSILLSYVSQWERVDPNFNRESYFRAIQECVNKRPEFVSILGITYVASPRLCGWFSVRQKITRPCAGFGVQPQGIPCCSGLQEIYTPGGSICLKTCNSNDDCKEGITSYGECVEVQIQNSRHKLCLNKRK